MTDVRDLLQRLSKLGEEQNLGPGLKDEIASTLTTLDTAARVGDDAVQKRQWIADLIRNGHDPKPSNWKASDTGWNDGAENIADKILPQHEDGSTFESTIKDLMEHIAVLDKRIAELSRIPSEEATEGEIEAAAKAIYDANPIMDQNVDCDGRPVSEAFAYPWNSLVEIGQPELREQCLWQAKAALNSHITRAPGAKT